MAFRIRPVFEMVSGLHYSCAAFSAMFEIFEMLRRKIRVSADNGPICACRDSRPVNSVFNLKE
jgi:hypothetical protein